MSYRLSIITINYNNAEGLKKTLQSVINQSCNDFEYIVIDGNSNDGSKEIISQYSKNITHFVSEKDSGIYNAMNKGIKIATGEYFLFLNSGDELENEKVVEKSLSSLAFFDLISGNMIYSTDGIPKTLFTPPNEVNLAYFLHSFLPHPSTFIKKELFQNIGLYNENLKVISDWEFFLKAVVIHQAKYNHLDEVISNFDNSGISSNPESENLIKKEKAEVYQNLFPNLKNEIKMIEFASSKRMVEIQHIQNYHPFLWKLLKGFLNILNIFSSQKEVKLFRKINRKT